MPKFVITEIWTRMRVVSAQDEEQALEKGDPEKFPFEVTVDPGALEGDCIYVYVDGLGLNLSNWHATEVK